MTVFNNLPFTSIIATVAVNPSKEIVTTAYVGFGKMETLFNVFVSIPILSTTTQTDVSTQPFL